MKKYKNYLVSGAMIALLVLSGCVLAGCSKTSKQSEESVSEKAKEKEKSDGTEKVKVKEFSIDTQINADYTDESYNESEATKIQLSETVTITEPGTYLLSGTLEDGQVIVNSKQSGKVRLVLDGVDINCSKGPGIYVIDGKTILTLAPDSENKVSDGTTYEDGMDAKACIYSKKDLCINGTGALTVNGNYEAGIQGKKDVRIINGKITVQAVGDGIKGKDSLVIAGGTLDITAGKDGIQATGTEENTGYILVSAGNIKISCESDAIRSATVVQVDGGTIDVQDSEEGIEALYIRMNAGDIKIIAKDDGINASGGSGKEDAIVPVIYMNGGTVYINAQGDGIDSNGNIYMRGGTLTIDGPTGKGDGFFDCGNIFEVTGGTLIGAGSSAMLEVPGNTSTQNMIIVGGLQGEAGTKVVLKDGQGSTVLSFTPAKTFQAVAFSSEDLRTGETYTAYLGETEVGSVSVEAGVNSIGMTGDIRGGKPGGMPGDAPGDRPEGAPGGMHGGKNDNKNPEGQRPDMGDVPNEKYY